MVEERVGVTQNMAFLCVLQCVVVSFSVIIKRRFYHYGRKQISRHARCLPVR